MSIPPHVHARSHSIHQFTSLAKKGFSRFRAFVAESPLPPLVLVVAAVASTFLPLALTLPFVVGSTTVLAGRLVVKALNHYNPSGAKELKLKVYGFFESRPYFLTALFFAGLGLSFLFIPLGLTVVMGVGLLKGFILELDVIKFRQNAYKTANIHTTPASLNLLVRG